MVCLRNILMLTLFTCFCAGELAARSYFLPDYQNKTYKARTNDGFVKKPHEQTCSNFPNTYDEDVPGKNCQPSKPLPGLNCYYCTDFTSACSDEYSATCDGEIIDTCEDSEGIKYKCKDVCADFTRNDECNNTSSGGYCVEPSKEECKSSYCDCIDYCKGMKQYEGATEIDNCPNGCAEGKEVEGCKGLCLECKVEEVSCTNNKEGNLVDASEMASYMEGAEFQKSPYSSECAALGYNEASCDSGYQKVGCPFNTTAGLFYHCVPTETYTSSEDTVETCPDGYFTEVTWATCTGDWTILVNNGTANGESCNKCDCLFSSASACSNGDLGCEEQTIDDKTCFVPICEDGWNAFMSDQIEQESAFCKEGGNDWKKWNGSDYCYRCDYEYQYCEEGYYSIYSQEVYDLKSSEEGNYLCKPQIGANAYEWCVQCEVCDDSNSENGSDYIKDTYNKYTGYNTTTWIDAAIDCTDNKNGIWTGGGCYYGCKTSGDSPDAPDTPATVEDECQKMDNMFHSRAVAEIECVDYGAMKAVTSECYSCLNVYDDIQITWDVSFIPSSACDDVGNTYTYDEASSICENNYQRIDVACITASGEHRYCCTNTSSGTLCQ